MTERPGVPPQDALPPHLDPRGRGRRRGSAPVPTLPAAPGRPAQRPRGAVLRRVALGLVVLLLVTTVATLGAVAYYDSRIERVQVPTLGQGVDVDGDDVNYLLVGSDSREGLTEQELQEARTTSDDGRDGTLTDTIVLVHVPSGGGQPSLVSFPRDAYVDIPGHGRGRINSAYARGEAAQDGRGPATLVATVQQLSGLQIDHYLEVGFIAFLRITDALGGVTVNLCQPTQDDKSGIDLPAGEQQLSGGDALAFVRQREGLPRGDLDRIERQQYFLGSVARQVLAPSTLVRPDRVLRVANAVTSSVRADQDLSTLDLARLGLRLRGAAGGGLSFVTVPVANANARVGGASVVLLDEAALPGFFADLSGSDEPPPTVQVPPAAIRLAVLNGTDQAGLAGQVAQSLQRQGYTVTRTGNADQQDARTSVVLHGSARADSARTVAASVPGAQVREDDSVGENGLVLVVGGDYSGVRTVAVESDQAPAPAPAGDTAAPAQAPAPAAPEQDAAGPCIT
jgi:LCP family protein required for cell wall assembly